MLSVSVQSFAYQEEEILSNISFLLKPGEHLALLGESGCGKSTLLHLIYGLLPLDDGTIAWNNRKLTGPEHTLVPGEPFMKLVAQDLNIMPYSTVRENIRDHLSGNDDNEIKVVEELLQVVELTPYGNTLVKNLSGGQQQRVAIAKALAKKPQLLLLDEPFSSIDNFRKNKLRRRLFAHLSREGIACITATHDAEEALMYADQILILQDTSIAVSGTPEQVFSSLSSAYLAGFFGEVTQLPKRLFDPDEPGDLFLLPHQLKVSEVATEILVTVSKSYFRGVDYLIESRRNEQRAFFLSPTFIAEGKNVYLSVK
ncbi:MAG: ABC transporter ATP-binding protein [Flavobacteriaceae bacterium]|nr:ABC transporter ATP-binding protein [Flavobacteriaceae bacterium]|tara:strand:- start:74 stop:1012 length:939 start_codon:yes stop_codon:yes gene_type:complete